MRECRGFAERTFTIDKGQDGLSVAGMSGAQQRRPVCASCSRGYPSRKRVLAQAEDAVGEIGEDGALADPQVDVDDHARHHAQADASPLAEVGRGRCAR